MTKYNGKKLQPSDRVRDHCHVSGKFRGAARSQSNLQARNNYESPIFVHNLKGYDAHLLFEELGSSTDGNLSVIVTNNEKYVSFAVTQKFTPEEIAMMKDDTMARKTKPWKLTFKDSCQFLLASLDKLVKTLRAMKISNTRASSPTSMVFLFTCFAKKGSTHTNGLTVKHDLLRLAYQRVNASTASSLMKCHPKKNTSMLLRYGKELVARHSATIMIYISSWTSHSPCPIRWTVLSHGEKSRYQSHSKRLSCHPTSTSTTDASPGETSNE